MKKTYIAPNLRTIDLFEESSILNGSQKLDVKSEAQNGDMFQSNEKNLWGSEGIWK